MSPYETNKNSSALWQQRRDNPIKHYNTKLAGKHDKRQDVPTDVCGEGHDAGEHVNAFMLGAVVSSRREVRRGGTVGGGSGRVSV